MSTMEEMEKRIQYLAAQQAAATGRDNISTWEIVADIIRHPSPRPFRPSSRVTHTLRFILHKEVHITQPNLLERLVRWEQRPLEDRRDDRRQLQRPGVVERLELGRAIEPRV